MDTKHLLVITKFYNSRHLHDSNNDLPDYDWELAFKVRNSFYNFL